MTGESSRVEQDSLGRIEIPPTARWGAHTERSRRNFPVGRDRYTWPRQVIRDLALVKRCCALANAELGVLDADVGQAIAAAAHRVERGEADDHFPIGVFQSGSGTNTNMNANEVIARLASDALGDEQPAVHPNDHVNASQSTNDVFPTVMHLTVLRALADRLDPAVAGLLESLAERRSRFGDVVKIGRTHLQDATPVTLGQELGAWHSQIDAAHQRLHVVRGRLHAVPLGGTATGTGLNAPPGFGARATALLSEHTGLLLSEAPDRLALTASHDALVDVSAALRTLASAVFKFGNDLRWLASGPRAGIGELRLPANEPGSSIMPGKVNPTQIEMLTMVVARVFGNDATAAFAGSQGAFELNAYKPIILDAVLDSIHLLADVIASFDERCVGGLEPVTARIAEHVEASLMLATALAPHIGYSATAAIAAEADRSGRTLRDVAVGDGHVSADDFDDWVDPVAMARPPD
jgi:fumarate hydratase class II